MKKGKLWSTTTTHIDGDDKFIVGKYYKFGRNGEFIKTMHMDITKCKFGISKYELYKMVKIEPELLTFEIYE